MCKYATSFAHARQICLDSSDHGHGFTKMIHVWNLLQLEHGGPMSFEELFENILQQKFQLAIASLWNLFINYIACTWVTASRMPPSYDNLDNMTCMPPNWVSRKMFVIICLSKVSFKLLWGNVQDYDQAQHTTILLGKPSTEPLRNYRSQRFLQLANFPSGLGLWPTW